MARKEGGGICTCRNYSQFAVPCIRYAACFGGMTFWRLFDTGAGVVGIVGAGTSRLDQVSYKTRCSLAQSDIGDTHLTEG